MKADKLFERAETLTEENKVALLYRLWGYLESDTPKFIKGLEIFISQLEEEQVNNAKQSNTW